jgi:hypothetical protein
MFSVAKGPKFWPQNTKRAKNCMGLKSGFTPLLYNKCGGEPRVKLGVWRPEMLALTTGVASPPPPHAVINTVYVI